jgi:hypothetical protein
MHCPRAAVGYGMTDYKRDEGIRGGLEVRVISRVIK